MHRKNPLWGLLSPGLGTKGPMVVVGQVHVGNLKDNGMEYP